LCPFVPLLDDLDDDMDSYFGREPTAKKVSLDNELDNYFDKPAAEAAPAAAATEAAAPAETEA